MISHKKIAGATLWYERGKFDQFRSFEFDPKFYRTLEECFLEIAEAFKPLSRVITAGAYVDKPGAHRLGRAFDLDGIEFEDGQVWKATERSGLTAAIQGVFMKKFGVVLGWTYDEDHADHLHIDDASWKWGFRESPSIVSYMQWVLELSGNSVKIDGLWGPKTERVFWRHLGTGEETKHYPNDGEYRRFLAFAVQKFFSQERRDSKPLKDEKTIALEKIRDLAAAALQEGDLG